MPVGDNILNLFLIIGVSGTINPLTLDRFTQFYSYGSLAVFFTVFIGLATTGHVHRRGGLLLLGLYVVYLAELVVVPMIGGWI